MLLRLEFPPLQLPGYAKRYLVIEDVLELPMPTDQPDLVVDVPEKKTLSLKLYNVDARGNKATPMELEFSTDAIPDFVPGQIRIHVLEDKPKPVSAPVKLGGDLKSKVGVDDPAKVELVKEKEE